MGVKVKIRDIAIPHCGHPEDPALWEQIRGKYVIVGQVFSRAQLADLLLEPIDCDGEWFWEVTGGEVYDFLRASLNAPEGTMKIACQHELEVD